VLSKTIVYNTKNKGQRLGALAKHLFPLVSAIASGAIAPGHRLLSQKLQKTLNVSPIPVREALKILQAQGILGSKPHRGVRVTQFDDAKIIQIYEVRCGLEKIRSA
jgi:DNA-binding GntR family transcriptional regulator